MTTIIFQRETILIISSILLLYPICLISTTIAYSTDSFEEETLMQRAYESLNEGEIEYALQLYDEILKVNPTHIDALNYKGLALARSGHYEEAIQWYDKVLNIDPTNVYALNNKGVAHYNLGHYDEAIQWYDKVLAIDPNDSDAKYNKSIALLSLNKLNEQYILYNESFQPYQ
ncbi:MAG TPA: tetratricopeptide repeat protein [Nitrososphaeraceae archaeon]